MKNFYLCIYQIQATEDKEHGGGYYKTGIVDAKIRTDILAHPV